MTALTSPLTTDLYELNMVQAYLDRAESNEAVFEFFVRRLPARRGFLLAAGLEDALQYLETMRYSDSEIAWLKGDRPLPRQSHRLSERLPLHRRRARHPRRHGVLCARAPAAHHARRCRRRSSSNRG